jgi:DNA-directed RNA polymerase specialized sigma24 family protein
MPKADEVKDGGARSEYPLEMRPSNRILRKIIGELGPGSQLVFVLRHPEELSVKGMARRLGLSVPAVKSCFRRVRLNITQKLNSTTRH